MSKPKINAYRLADVSLNLLLACFVGTLLLSLSCQVRGADIRVMTLNTEWLWTPFDGHADGQVVRHRDPSIAEYRKEIDFYSQLILAQRADIVALAEIENELVIDDFVTRLGGAWKGYFKQGRDTATGQDVALLSRLPYVENSLSDFDFPAGSLPGWRKAKRLSKVLGARFELPAAAIQKGGKVKTVGVITAHFLSKRNEKPAKARARLKQALALVKASKRFSVLSDQLILLGDFNDYAGSATIEIMLNGARLTLGNAQCNPLATRLQFARTVDHILYRQFSCNSYQQFDLKPYSDHRAVLMTLTPVF